MAQAASGGASAIARALVSFDYACTFCYLDWPSLRLPRAEHTAHSECTKDIGRVEVVVCTAAEAGLDMDELVATLGEGRFDELLHQFRDFVLQLGIAVTSATLIRNELFIGARPYRVLAEALQRLRVFVGDIELSAGGNRVTSRGSVA